MNVAYFFICLCVLSIAAVSAAQAAGTTTDKTVIILLGPPGSGKGTQAVRITQKLGIPHISTGDLFRENISKNTELGQRAKSFMDTGKLVPDEVVLDMLFDRVSKPDCDKGYLLDGFPRTLPQAEALQKHLDKGTKLIVLNLEVPDDVIVKRAAGRLTCKVCGNVHNIHFSPPLKEGLCDKCGNALITRTDDKPEVVAERLRVYRSQTLPLVDYYKKKGVLHSVDGTQKPDDVFNALMKAM